MNDKKFRYFDTSMSLMTVSRVVRNLTSEPDKFRPHSGRIRRLIFGLPSR